MEIDITHLMDVEMFAFSHSIAEGGLNAGRETWRAAKEGPRPILTTDAERAAFRAYCAGFGAWEKDEIAAWNNNELDALCLQMIAANVREARFDTLGEINWDEYAGMSEAGAISGDLFKGDDGRIYFSISE